VKNLVDDVVSVTDDEAVAMTHNLWAEGFSAGVSSRAKVFVALREAKKFEVGTVVTVLPDRADRYFTEEHYVT
jgi:cysteine synthase